MGCGVDHLSLRFIFYVASFALRNNLGFATWEIISFFLFNKSKTCLFCVCFFLFFIMVAFVVCKDYSRISSLAYRQRPPRRSLRTAYEVRKEKSGGYRLNTTQTRYTRIQKRRGQKSK